MKRGRSRWEATLEQQLRIMGLHPEVEYVFAPPRRWRFDFAWPVEKVAAEVEGITRFGGMAHLGRHQTASGIEADCYKYNAAAIAGWAVVRVTQGMIQSGEACRLVEQALKARRAA